MTQQAQLATDFLIWLDCYVGTWECQGQKYEIARRPDGWLVARTVENTACSLKWLLENAKRIKEAPSPLGMYPIGISDDLMRIWLTPEENKNLRNAWRVGPGMKILMETIERNIRESDQATRRKKLEEMWAAGKDRSEPWTQEDTEVYQTLMVKHRSSAGFLDGT